MQPKLTLILHCVVYLSPFLSPLFIPHLPTYLSLPASSSSILFFSSSAMFFRFLTFALAHAHSDMRKTSPREMPFMMDFAGSATRSEGLKKSIRDSNHFPLHYVSQKINKVNAISRVLHLKKLVSI